MQLRQTAALVEVNSETDFVARNEEFQKAVRTIADIALKNEGDVEKTQHAAAPDGGTVGEMLLNLVAKVGENMALRRAAALSVSDGVVANYMHNTVATAWEKSAFSSRWSPLADKARLTDLGRKIAMHVAAPSRSLPLWPILIPQLSTRNDHLDGTGRGIWQAGQRR